jgi:tRNA A-37 threonylcarbamoyl transferase component Bud32
MERIAHRRTVCDALAEARDPAERADLLESLGVVVARLHAAGWYHRDLYLQHFVLPEHSEREFVLLDVGRARREDSPRRRWFVKDIAALLHSSPLNITRAERLRFLEGWLSERAPERDALRRWARAIQRKEARIAAHAPRFVDPDGGGQ